MQSAGNRTVSYDNEFEEAVAPPTVCLLHLGGFELQRELGLEAFECLLGTDRIPAVTAAAARRAVGVGACSDAVNTVDCKHTPLEHRERLPNCSSPEPVAEDW